MTRLDAAARAKLPDSAYAYVDSHGRRKLPIHDEAHVRNALARFNLVAFEDEAAKARARKRLLNAAKKHKIVPVGFISGQLQSERALGEQHGGAPVRLPSGFVTMMMTDIESSTALLHQLGDGYRQLLEELTAFLHDFVVSEGGQVVEARADELFAAFELPQSAIGTAQAIQRGLRDRKWADEREVRIRIGVHSGYPTLTKANYVGMAVHTAARISAIGHGGQVLVSDNTKEALAGSTLDGIRWKNLGPHRLRGIPDEVVLYQLMAKGLIRTFPPLRTS